MSWRTVGSHTRNRKCPANGWRRRWGRLCRHWRAGLVETRLSVRPRARSCHGEQLAATRETESALPMAGGGAGGGSVDIGEGDWSKLAYQFGHELGHVMANSWQPHAKPKVPCQWLEEALVEALSTLARGIGRNSPISSATS